VKKMTKRKRKKTPPMVPDPALPKVKPQRLTKKLKMRKRMRKVKKPKKTNRSDLTKPDPRTTKKPLTNQRSKKKRRKIHRICN